MTKKNTFTLNPIITAPVLIPNTPDCEHQYGEEVLSSEKIEQLAYSFNKYQIIDLQHEFTKRLLNKLYPIPRGKLLKSYIAQEKLYLKGLDGHTREYPRGTWILKVEITDPEAKKLYYNSTLTGLSVTVKDEEHADAIIKFLKKNKIPYLPSENNTVEKGFYKKPQRILMKNVINPVAFTVSLVKAPCVYNAKFCRNSCLIVNEDKLKENKIVNIKEKIKKEINHFIDGLDVDESQKESIETNTNKEKEQTDNNTEELESQKEDISSESEKSCDKTKVIYGRKVNLESVKETTTKEEDDDDDEDEKNTDELDDEESQKEVLYLAQDDVENLISKTLRRYAEEIEQLVFDGIQEALDDYILSQDTSYKEEKESTKQKTIEETTESQKEYVTEDMAKSIFEEQFDSFKSTIMDSIKQAQKESIKSYSKSITSSDDGLNTNTEKQDFTPTVKRDFNGCRIRKR